MSSYLDWKPVNGDIRVPPLSHIQIIHKARELVSKLGLEAPIDCEKALNLLSDADYIQYEVLEDERIPNAYGVTNKLEISLRASVIEAVGNIDDPHHTRHRFTVSHELGHAVLHNKINYGLMRAEVPKKPYEAAECQANAFASFFLVPFEIVKELNFNKQLVMERCRVSDHVARIAIENYKRQMRSGNLT